MSASPKFQLLPSTRGDRQMPASEEAEQHVLAACLVDSGDTLGRALRAGVSPKAFFWPQHQMLWETMVEMFRATKPVSVEALVVELTTRKQLEAAGGLEFLFAITEKVPTTAHAGFYIDTVLQMSALRLAVRIGTETVELAYGYAGGSLDGLFADQLTALSSAVKHARRGGGPASLKDQIKTVVADVTAANAGQLDKSGWIYTGLQTFDKRCLPMGSARADYLVVIAGGSGTGKSAFMRGVAARAVLSPAADGKLGQRARIYTREDGIDGCIEQMASAETGLDLKHKEVWPREQLEKFTAACAALEAVADKRLWCIENTDATPMMTIEDLEEDARYFAATHGAPDLWVVDYLQLFGSRKPKRSREEEVAYVSHKLQGLSRTLGGVWLVGCQMNEKGLSEMRTVRKDADGKTHHRLPNAGDLRESQAIYHDADRVIALYLPPVDSRDQDQTGPNILKPEVWLCQIKRRKGGTGVVKCWFEKQFTRFAELPSFTHAAATSTGGGMTKTQFKQEQPR